MTCVMRLTRELISQLDSRPGPARASPSISGIAYESTPEEGVRSGGAHLFRVLPRSRRGDNDHEQAGQCGLYRLLSGQHGREAAVKAGYTTNGTVVVIANDDLVLDIGLRR